MLPLTGHRRRLVVVAALATAFATPTGAQDVEPGPELYAPRVPGLLARPVTAAPMAANGAVDVEMWDLLVGPRTGTEPFDLPGGAVLQVRSGSAVLTIDGEAREIRLGDALAVDPGRRLQIDNRRSTGPLTLRATLIRAR